MKKYFSILENICNFTNSERIEPDKVINTEKNLEIKGKSFEITFDKNSDQINLPSEMIIVQENDKLLIKIPEEWKKHNKTVIMQIGTRNRYENFLIDSASLEISGDIDAVNYSINSSSTEIDGNMNIEKNISIDCSSFELSGILKSENLKIDSSSTEIDAKIEVKEKIDINCSSLEINGYIDTNIIKINSSSTNIDCEINARNKVSIDTSSFDGDYLKIKAESIYLNTSSNSTNGELDARHIKIDASSSDIDLKISRAETVEIDISTLDGKIEYVDSWTGTRTIILNKRFQNFEIITSTDNEGILNKIYR